MTAAQALEIGPTGLRIRQDRLKARHVHYSINSLDDVMRYAVTYTVRVNSPDKDGPCAEAWCSVTHAEYDRNPFAVSVALCELFDTCLQKINLSWSELQ